MEIGFSVERPLMRVSEDEPSVVTCSMSLEVDLGDGTPMRRRMSVTREMEEPAPPDVFEPLHGESSRS